MSDEPKTPNRIAAPTGHYQNGDPNQVWPPTRPALRAPTIEIAGTDPIDFARGEGQLRAATALRGTGTQNDTEIAVLEGRLARLIAKGGDQGSLSPSDMQELASVTKSLEWQKGRSAEIAQAAPPAAPTQGRFDRAGAHAPSTPEYAEYAAAEVFKADMEAAVNRTLRTYGRRGLHLTATEATEIVAAEVRRSRALALPNYDRLMRRHGQ